MPLVAGPLVYGGLSVLSDMPAASAAGIAAATSAIIYGVQRMNNAYVSLLYLHTCSFNLRFLARWTCQAGLAHWCCHDSVLVVGSSTVCVDQRPCFCRRCQV